MGPVFYVMAIMGCGDGGEACRQAMVEPAHYASAAACQAALPTVLARHTDLDYPSIAAACQRNGQDMAQRDVHARRG